MALIPAYCYAGGAKQRLGVLKIEVSFRGIMLIGLINSGLVQLHVPPYYEQIVKGMIIVGAVWLDKRVQK